MKRIGVLGGMSWESTLEYYRIMNEIIKVELGNSHSANCLLYSFDFDEVEKLQHKNQWDELTSLMVAEASNLKLAGAEFIVIATNTMHIMAKDINAATGLPVLHIADATGDEIKKRKVQRVLLLGTKFTMEGDFYRTRLEERGIEVIIPNEEDRHLVHQIIYEELIHGKITTSSKSLYKSIIEKNISDGVEGVILGCTEIPLLINQEDISIEVFDTTSIHAKAAVMFALKES